MPLTARRKALRLALLTLTVLPSHASLAQIATGSITGKLHDAEREPVKAVIVISSEPGFRAMVNTDAQGTFSLTLPYGRYEVTVQDRRASISPTVSIDVKPLQNQDISLIIDSSGKIRIETGAAENAGVWSGSPQMSSGGFNFAFIMLNHEPGTATQPLSFAGLGDDRLAWQSQRGFSWTGTEFKLMGMDATNSFQPGQPAILPDVSSSHDRASPRRPRPPMPAR